MGNASEFLSYLITAGLGADIVGFALVVLNGHAIFIRVSNRPPTGDEVREMRNGDMWIQHEGDDAKGNSRQRKCAWLGVALVVLGFSLQLIGSLERFLR